MEIEWIAQDKETLAHASKVKIDGKATTTPHQALQAVSPHHATTKLESQQLEVAVVSACPKTAISIAGEMLLKPTLENVGRSRDVTDALIERMRLKLIDGHINLVYMRIPSGYTPAKGVRTPAPLIDDLRAAALVDVQLETDAALIIPPVPTDISNLKVFNSAMERTKVSIQTFNDKKGIVGYIPTTDHLEIVRDMVKAYVKNGVHFFAVDFSGASNNPSLIRTVVRTIRENLKIKGIAKEVNEKYYLHIFNVTPSKKSILEVSPLSDILTHMYGVDSTSSTMWGGGKLDVAKLRYYNTRDYGAYRKVGLGLKKLDCSCPICKQFNNANKLYDHSVNQVFNLLRNHRIYTYHDECQHIATKLSAGKVEDGYLPYLRTKNRALKEVEAIMSDVREVKSSLW